MPSPSAGGSGSPSGQLFLRVAAFLRLGVFFAAFLRLEVFFAAFLPLGGCFVIFLRPSDFLRPFGPMGGVLTGTELIWLEQLASCAELREAHPAISGVYLR